MLILDIVIGKKALENKGLSHESISVYATIQLIKSYHFNDKQLYVNSNMIYFYMNGFIDKVSRKKMEQIKSGLDCLVDNGIIVPVNIVGKYEYILNVKDLDINSKDDYFVKISYDEYNKIMTCGKQVNRYQMFSYFCTIISNINYSKNYFNKSSYVGKFCGLTLKVLAEKSMINNYRLLCKEDGYNDILEELKLLYIYKSDTIKRIGDGQYENLNNIYCRYKDKDLADEYGKSRDASFSIKPESNAKVINMSMSKKYSYLVSNTYKGNYSKNEIIDILEWAKKYNEKEEEYELSGWLWKEKDVSLINSRLKESNDSS